MDDLELEPEEKNFVGNLDRAVVNFGLVCLAIFPTFLILIFRPKAMVPLLRGEHPDGRDGLKLGPGVTFILSVLLLLAIALVLRNSGVTAPLPDDVEANSGLRAALAEGNLWRSILLSLPLYFAALTLGLIIQVAHLIVRQKTELRPTIAIGLYIMSVLLLLLVPIGVSSERYEPGSSEAIFVVAIVLITLSVVLPWLVFSFSKHAFGNRTWGAAIVAVLSLILIMTAIVVFGIIASSFEI